MSNELDVRFHRALHAHRPGWGKWDFDSAPYPLLRKIQCLYGEALARSFPDDHDRFHVDFIDLETLDACTLLDMQQPIVFIGLTRCLIDELLRLTNILANSAEVQTLFGAPPSPPAEESTTEADALFFAALGFVIAHEVGHYVHDHIGDRALHLEYSGPHRAMNLCGHRDELAADEYAIEDLCRNVFDGELRSEVIGLLPLGGAYGTDQLAALLAISVTAVFLLHLTLPRPPFDPAKDKHPPLAYRQHRMIAIMQHWPDPPRIPRSHLLPTGAFQLVTLPVSMFKRPDTMRSPRSTRSTVAAYTVLSKETNPTACAFGGRNFTAGFGSSPFET